MTHRRLYIAATIIAVIVIGGFVLSVPHTRDIPETLVPRAVSPLSSVTLRDVFKKGVHTITGSLLVPNACATVSASATLQGDASSTEHILVQISFPLETGVCLELPTLVHFSTTITAPASLPITATVNSAPATTTHS